MQLPRPITPSTLQDELLRRGRAVSSRALIDWRRMGLLPKLLSRGRGRGRGKENYWRSPKIIEQTILVDELMKLNIPNDRARLIIWLLGFPIKAHKVREAWLSSLGKLAHKQEAVRQKLIQKRESEFPEIEDELSALTAQFVRRVTVQFGMDRDQSAQILIYLFGLSFRRGYFPDIGLLHDLTAFIGKTGTIPSKQLEQEPEREFNIIVKFIGGRMSFSAVLNSVESAADIDFNHAHRRWRKLLKLVQRAIPELADKKYAAVGFGRLIVPVIMQLIGDGRTSQIDRSIGAITELIPRTELAGIIGELLLGNDIGQMEKMALGYLSATLGILGDIWDHHDFPFAVKPHLND